MKNVKIEAILRDMAKRNGGTLLPEIVVAEARNPKHPLHKKFEWNNTKAAQEYRLWQARQLIRVCVQILPNIKDPVHVFCSLSTDRPTGQGYRVTTEVMSEPERRAQLLQDALFDMNTFVKKYAVLKELAEVFQAMQQVRKKAA